MKERELKILLDGPGLERLRRSPALRTLGHGGITARLHTQYFDTAGKDLAKAGIALRLRHEGATWTQTVKRKRRHLGGLSEADEISVPRAHGTLDIAALANPELEADIAKAADGQPLEPVTETEIERTAIHLALPGIGEAELALDAGEIRAGTRAATIHEVEIEHRSGSLRVLYEIAKRLLPDGGLRLSRLNKAERARLLRETGAIEARPEPRQAAPVALTPGQTAESAARDTFAECFDQITANAAFILDHDDAEGPHQLRVGLRRLRSAALVYRDAVACEALDRLTAEAKWLAGEASAMRDLDVAAEDVLADAADAHLPEPGFAALEAELARRRVDMREALRRTLRSPRTHAFLFDLGAFFSARGWMDASDWSQTARLAEPVGHVAVRALDRRLAKAAKQASGISKLTIDERHELRKSLKKLRYAVEFFQTLYPESEVKPFLKRLKGLQDILGDLNDAAMAESLFLDPHGPASRSLPIARAAGRVIGIRTERARVSWARAKESWSALKETKPFWR